MTKKRFTVVDGAECVVDNEKGIAYVTLTNRDALLLLELLNGLYEELQIKDYSLQKQLEITENQQQRIKNLEEQLQNLRKKVNEQYVTWREWE